MAFKLVIAFALLVAAASAGFIPTSHHQLYQHHHQQQHIDATPVYHHAPAHAYGHEHEYQQHAAYAAVPVTATVVEHKAEPYDHHPQYKFSYGVEDAHTGDSKSHVEERDGDVVRGEYSLVDPDGYKRIVRYTADKYHGFNAVVERIPLVKTVAHSTPVYVSAPVYHQH